MSFNPMDSLGWTNPDGTTKSVDDVPADPNAIPDGTYDATLTKIAFVHSKGKNRISHVFTYTVDGRGAQVSQWFNLGEDPQFDANGDLTGYKPTMSEDQASWYKKGFTDLGVPEDQVRQYATKEGTASLIGKKVTLGVKVNTTAAGTFRNVTSVTLRDQNSGDGAPVAMGNEEFASATPAPAVNENDLSSAL